MFFFQLLDFPLIFTYNYTCHKFHLHTCFIHCIPSTMKKSFTLIELLVVIAIIAILA
ncbi:MAG: type II secretion system protein, partial [Victivallales bacterium]|nr:type II secretion system protein [Victivallales bacterium]